MTKFIDVSGYGNSGKTAVSDLLKEVEDITVSPATFEFELIRIQGGLIDLKSALVDNWSPIRVDAAIRRFQRIALKFGVKASFRSIGSLFIASGNNYNDHFHNKFTKCSSNFIESLITDQFIGEWPYQMIEKSNLNQFKQRLLNLLGIKKHFLTSIYLGGLNESEFLECCHSYLRCLFKTWDTHSNATFVTHNAIEPYNPSEGLKILPNSKLIVVRRDPRDIYISAMHPASLKFIPSFESKRNLKLKQNMLGLPNIEKFCSRQLTFFKNTRQYDKDKVLLLTFEQLINDYEKVKQDIFNFLEINSELHVKKKFYFDPEKSKNNIGLWENYKEDENIKIIEEKLAPYLSI